jgi:hypothetical protein
VSAAPPAVRRMNGLRVAGFLATFLAAWFALDRLATAPPMPVPALLALAASCVVPFAVFLFGDKYFDIRGANRWTPTSPS